MVIANLTLRGGHAWSTLFYSLSLGYSVPYLVSRGKVESAKHQGAESRLSLSLFPIKHNVKHCLLIFGFSSADDLGLEASVVPLVVMRVGRQLECPCPAA